MKLTIALILFIIISFLDLGYIDTGKSVYGEDNLVEGKDLVMWIFRVVLYFIGFLILLKV